LEDIQSDLVIWPSTRKFMLADWCFRTWMLWLSHHIGNVTMSSSQLTKSIIFQRGKPQPPTRHCILPKSHVRWPCKIAPGSIMAPGCHGCQVGSPAGGRESMAWGVHQENMAI
jgi:hypothetical protein